MINLHNGEKETERKTEKNEGIKDEEREREEVKDKENKKSLKERQTDLYKASEDAVESKYVIDHRRCITAKQYRGV